MSDKHDLFLRYTKLALEGGLSFSDAVWFADSRLHINKTSSVDDFTIQEKIAGQAYVAGQKLAAQVKKEQEESKYTEVQREDRLVMTFQKSKMTTPSDEIRKSVSLPIDELKNINFPPADIHNIGSSDTVISSAVDFMELPSETTNTVEELAPQIPMVDPANNKLQSNPVKVRDGIQESTVSELGRSDIPLRYEDRVKLAQNR